MIRVLLHLLLVATLALNGIGAPWAAAHHAHAAHGATPEQDAQVPEQASMHAHHGHAVVSTGPAVSGHESGCCEDGACRCGCVLPPVLGTPLRATVSAAPQRVDFFLSAPPVAPGHERPPFRPPAA